MSSSRHTVALADSIGTRLLMLVFAIYVMVTAVFTAIHMYAEFDNTRTTVTYELRALAKTLNQGLATAIYNVDDRQIRSILDGVMESPIVVGIKIETEYQGNFTAGEAAVRPSGNEDSLLTFTDTIVYSEPGSPNVPMGVLTLHSSRGVILGKVWHSLMLILVNSVFKTFALWIIFLWMSRAMLSRPLSRLTTAAREIDLDKLDDYTVETGTRGRNELKVLEEAFNSMIEKLLRSRKQSERLTLSLRRAGEQLAEYNRTLEEKVRERTRELNRLLEEVQHSRRMAEIANKAKSDFLASMSHEIRTPLNAIIGISDVLADTELTLDQRQCVDIFRSSGETLLAIINDILDFSKIEAGQITLEAIPFNMEDVVVGACDTLAPGAFDKGVELVCRLDPELPRRMVGDPTRLRQIISNLVANAIKFTARGEIVVSAKPAGESPGEILFSVRDTGIGIPESKREIIFDGFTQADSSTTRLFGGTGLGLAICSRLIKLMGGRIWLEDGPESGSIFHCLVPLELPEEEAPSTSIRILEGSTALVVEPNESSREALVADLESLGAQVTAAGSLADVRPSLEGFDLLLAARDSLPHGGPAALPWLVRESGLALILSPPAGHVSHSPGDTAAEMPSVVKPATRSKIARVVSQARSCPLPVAEAAPARKAEGLNLLLAEDQGNNRKLIELFLQDTPHHLVLAENGLQAVETFKQDVFDAVLMDMEMPVMDGYTATRRIREFERNAGLSPTPIIALTAHAFEEHVRKTAQAGCTAHLTKPIKKQTFLAALDALAEDGPNLAQTAFPADDFSASPRRDEEPEVELERGMQPLVEEYLIEVRESIAAIRRALMDNDMETVRVTGHSLKGSGGGYGFHEISVYGRALEEAGAAGSASRVRIPLADLERYVQAVRIRYID